MTPTFTGVWPILVTTFQDGESLALASLRRVVRFMVEAGMNVVAVRGMLSEFNRVTNAERAEIVRTTVDCLQRALDWARAWERSRGTVW